MKTMPTESYVAGLDVGTTRIRTVVAQPDLGGALRILGVGVVPADGLARGIVVDRTRAIAAITESVHRAQRNASLDLGGAYVGVSGAHIACRNVTGRVHVSSGEVTRTDIEKVIQSARDSVRTGPEQQIIHTLVRDFAVDGERGIRHPEGMRGNRLDVEVHVITGVGSIIGNLEDSVLASGLRVLKHVLEPVATATAVITEAERDLGVILVDIGGGTTDLAVFSEGSICHTASLPVAGNHVTRDLAQLLRIRPEDAETTKRRFGVALAELATGEEMIPVREIGTEQETRLSRRLLGEIIQPRMEEIFNLVKENLLLAGFYETIGGGVVLAGGGSQLVGAARLASIVLDNLPVRVGAPRNLTGLGDSVDSPSYATAVGLAMMAARDQAWAAPSKPGPGAGPWEAAKSWWKQTILPAVRRLTGSR
jgi:cell division protein FtsA